MDPPFWYAGMKNHELQVMFYGKDIAQAEFSLKSYPGVKVKEVAKVKNPNYLIVYLDVTEKARPGTMTFRFKEGRTVTEKAFELRPRNTKTGAQGFSTKDVLYLIMPDRFANGNPANDDWEQFKADRRNGGGHHGGDLQGIRDHLGYIDSLGVTAVWLNPVQYNRSNASHGLGLLPDRPAARDQRGVLRPGRRRARTEHQGRDGHDLQPLGQFALVDRGHSGR